jgi:hypothetical protein
MIRLDPSPWARDAMTDEELHALRVWFASRGEWGTLRLSARNRGGPFSAVLQLRDHQTWGAVAPTLAKAIERVIEQVEGARDGQV